MKTIKFNHELADQIRSGTKTATWRVYDDKHLSVNDRVQLVDKVVSDDPSTWVVFAEAIIDKVVEKRLGALQESDMDGHATYASQEAMLADFQKYYGPQVTLDTAIKLIHFHVVQSLQNESLEQTVASKTSELTEVKLYADGGSRGNPGPSASGFVLLTMDDQVLVEKGVYLGITTNNQAEYQALKLGLEEAGRLRVKTVHVYMDSLLVVNQMKGIFKVKNRDLWPIHESAKELSKSFKQVSFTQVPRELNKAADAQVNIALDAAEVAQP